MIFNLLEGVWPSYYFAVFCTTQSTASAEQWNGASVYDGVGSRVSESGYRVSDNTYRVPNQAYRAFDDGFQVSNATYKAYQRAVYEPFNDTPPSEAGGNRSQISGRKNAWGGGGMGDNENDDPGHRDPNSPVGEPLVLLLFAVVAALFVAIRKKEPTPALPRGKE